MVQAWFFTCGICGHWRFSFCLVFEGYPSVVIDVDYNDVVFYGMGEYFWNGVSLSGRTVRTELSELGCVSWFNGATSLCFLDLFIFFAMVQAWFFYCGGFESVLLRFWGSDYFWLLAGGGEMWGPSEQWKLQDSSWMDSDGRKMEKRSGSREHALGRLVDWFTVGVSESFIKYRLVVVVMVDHHVAWHIQTKLDGRASIISEAHMCYVRRETTYNESWAGSKRWPSIFVVVACFGLRRVLREKPFASICLN